MGDELPLFPLPHLNLRLALNRGVANGVHEALAADAHFPLAPALVLPPLPSRRSAELSSVDMADSSTHACMFGSHQGRNPVRSMAHSARSSPLCADNAICSKSVNLALSNSSFHRTSCLNDHHVLGPIFSAFRYPHLPISRTNFPGLVISPILAKRLIHKPRVVPIIKDGFQLIRRQVFGDVGVLAQEFAEVLPLSPTIPSTLSA